MSLFFGARTPQAPYPSAKPQDSTGQMLKGAAHVEDPHRKTMTNSVCTFFAPAGVVESNRSLLRYAPPSTCMASVTASTSPASDAEISMSMARARFAATDRPRPLPLAPRDESAW